MSYTGSMPNAAQVFRMAKGGIDVGPGRGLPPEYKRVLLAYQWLLDCDVIAAGSPWPPWLRMFLTWMRDRDEPFVLFHYPDRDEFTVNQWAPEWTGAITLVRPPEKIWQDALTPKPRKVSS